MSRRWRMIYIAPLAILGMAAFIAIGGEIVLHLWNWLLPRSSDGPDHFLASAGDPGVVPRALRRTGTARLPRLQFPPSHQRTL
jgi:hypothetical protein